MRFGSLFTGIGGFDLGFERAGMDCAWQVEIDAACQSTLARHWPNVKRFGDVRNVGRDILDSVDLICGGFPCQDLSIAGKRAGLAGERSGLWYEFHRILAELKPQWVVIENVPGLLSSEGGRDFAAVLRGLVELRYGVCWRVLDAQYFGVAQRRRRVFVVGSLGDGCAAQVLFEREGGAWDTPPSREARARLATDVAASLKGGSGQRGFPIEWEAGLTTIAFTGMAQGGAGWPPPSCPTNDNQALPLDATRAQAVAYKKRGGFGWSEDEGLAQTLESEGGTHQGGPERVPLIVNSLESSDGGTDENDAIGGRLVVNALTERMGRYSSPDPATGKGSPIVVIPPLTESPYADNESQDGKLVVARSTGAGWYTEDDKGSVRAQSGGTTFDLIAFDHCLQGSERTWIHRGDGYAQLQASRPDAVAGNFGVRRLTPVECERLQDFPDGWTDEQSDSVRYRQLGNAVCVPVAEWIGKRLEETSRHA